MGDRRYTRRGERKYIGLQNEILERPWTAKRYNRRADSFDPNDCTIDSIGPGGDYPLGDIVRLSKALRRALVTYQTVARFTEDREKKADPELQQVVKQAEKIQHTSVEAFKRCCIALQTNLEELGEVNSTFSRLTFEKQDWWEGHNLFSRGKLIGHCSELRIDSNKKYHPILSRTASPVKTGSCKMLRPTRII
jgi:hypothetical protein